MPVIELENFRKKFPQYNDLDDFTLATKLAKKFPVYRDILEKARAQTYEIRALTPELKARLRPPTPTEEARMEARWMRAKGIKEDVLGEFFEKHPSLIPFAIASAAGGIGPLTSYLTFYGTMNVLSKLPSVVQIPFVRQLLQKIPEKVEYLPEEAIKHFGYIPPAYAPETILYRPRQYITSLIQILEELGKIGAAIKAGRWAGMKAETLMPPIIEKLTKQTITTYNLPRTVSISAEKIKDIFQSGEKISPYELDLIKSLGLTGAEYREAIQKGLTINIPAEKVVHLVDKPYWRAIKEFFFIPPAPPIRKVISPGIQKIFRAPAGALPALPSVGKPPVIPVEEPKLVPTELSVAEIEKPAPSLLPSEPVPKEISEVKPEEIPKPEELKITPPTPVSEVSLPSKPYIGLKPGTEEWMQVWKTHPELQEEMLEYQKSLKEQGIIPEVPKPIKIKPPKLPKIKVKPEETLTFQPVEKPVLRVHVQNLAEVQNNLFKIGGKFRIIKETPNYVDLELELPEGFTPEMIRRPAHYALKELENIKTLEELRNWEKKWKDIQFAHRNIMRQKIFLQKQMQYESSLEDVKPEVLPTVKRILDLSQPLTPEEIELYKASADPDIKKAITKRLWYINDFPNDLKLTKDISRLIDKYSHKIKGLTDLKLNDPSRYEEIVQDTFIALKEDLKSFLSKGLPLDFSYKDIYYRMKINLHKVLNSSENRRFLEDEGNTLSLFSPVFEVAEGEERRRLLIHTIQDDKAMIRPDDFDTLEDLRTEIYEHAQINFNQILPDEDIQLLVDFRLKPDFTALAKKYNLKPKQIEARLKKIDDMLTKAIDTNEEIPKYIKQMNEEAERIRDLERQRGSIIVPPGVEEAIYNYSQNTRVFLKTTVSKTFEFHNAVNLMPHFVASMYPPFKKVYDPIMKSFDIAKEKENILQKLWRPAKKYKITPTQNLALGKYLLECSQNNYYPTEEELLLKFPKNVVEYGKLIISVNRTITENILKLFTEVYGIPLEVLQEMINFSEGYITTHRNLQIHPWVVMAETPDGKLAFLQGYDTASEARKMASNLQKQGLVVQPVKHVRETKLIEIDKINQKIQFRSLKIGLYSLRKFVSLLEDLNAPDAMIDKIIDEFYKSKGFHILMKKDWIPGPMTAQELLECGIEEAIKTTHRYHRALGLKQAREGLKELPEGMWREYAEDWLEALSMSSPPENKIMLGAQRVFGSAVINSVGFAISDLFQPALTIIDCLTDAGVKFPIAFAKTMKDFPLILAQRLMGKTSNFKGISPEFNDILEKLYLQGHLGASYLEHFVPKSPRLGNHIIYFLYNTASILVESLIRQFSATLLYHTGKVINTPPDKIFDYVRYGLGDTMGNYRPYDIPPLFAKLEKVPVTKWFVKSFRMFKQFGMLIYNRFFRDIFQKRWGRFLLGLAYFLGAGGMIGSGFWRHFRRIKTAYTGKDPEIELREWARGIPEREKMVETFLNGFVSVATGIDLTSRLGISDLYPLDILAETITTLATKFAPYHTRYYTPTTPQRLRLFFHQSVLERMERAIEFLKRGDTARAIEEAVYFPIFITFLLRFFREDGKVLNFHNQVVMELTPEEKFIRALGLMPERLSRYRAMQEAQLAEKMYLLSLKSIFVDRLISAWRNNNTKALREIEKTYNEWARNANPYQLDAVRWSEIMKIAEEKFRSEEEKTLPAPLKRRTPYLEELFKIR